MTRQNRTSSADHEIDENLKRAFDNVASEPLPSRFTDLLDQLKNSGAKPANDDEASTDK